MGWPAVAGVGWILGGVLLAQSPAIGPAKSRDGVSRAGGQTKNQDPVPVAHVDPQVTVLPVVDGDSLRFTRISTDEGLSQTRVTEIVQDDQGFMWFASQYGLNRYDGYQFKVFKHEAGRENSLSGVYIYSLFKDRSGALWIGCEESLDRLDPITEQITHYSIGNRDEHGHTLPVTHISQDRAGMLWLATRGGLYRFDPSTRQTTLYQHDSNNPYSLSSSLIKYAGEDAKGTFWVATSEGLDALDPNTSRVTLHIPMPERGEVSFHEDRFGLLWIIHITGGGLAAFDRNTNTLTQYALQQAPVSEALPTGMTGILEDRDGTLWFGSMGNGLLKFDRKAKRLIRYRHDPANPESLGENDVGGLFQDREGNIWACLHMMAPNHFAPRPSLFEKFKNEPGKKDSFSGTMVNGIYQDREGILWISGIDALNRVDRKSGKYTFYRIAGPTVNWRPTSILADRSGFLWVGSDGHGLVRFDPRTEHFESFRHHPGDPYSLSSDLVVRVFIDRSGRLWATTFDGLDRFDPATSRFTVYKAEKQNGAQIDIDVKEDAQGMLWVGTNDSGLERFDPESETFTSYEHSANDPMSLSNNRVNSIYFDHSGTMWVGTQDGLDRFDRASGKFKTYYLEDGLSGNVVSCILEDERGHLWMSTNNGISKFDAATQTFATYSMADGLPGADLTGWGACSKSSSGEMFFGGFSGGVAFHPDRMVDDPYVPPVVLSDFRIFDRPVPIGPDSTLKKSIGYTTAVRLSHDQNIFSFEFSALSYFSPASNRYRYKLEGLDRDWHEVGSNQRLVTYTTLPAKTYRLLVQGATSRGPWSQPSVELSIEIRPAWWNTWWVRILGVTLLIGLLWILHRRHIHELKAQEERLRNVVETIPAMTFTALSDGTCTFVNKRWTEYTGLSVEQSCGAGWQHALHPADFLSHAEKWRVSISGGELFEDEARFRRSPDGEYRWFLVRGVPLRDPSGNIVRWYGTLTDIEDRKRAVGALEQSQFYLAEGQRVAHMGSWALTRAGFDHWSSELFKIHGLDPQRKPPTLEEYLGLVHPEDHDFVSQKFQRMLADDTGFDFTKRIMRPDGEIRSVRWVGIPVSSGQIFQEFVGTGIDVTEQVRLTEELRRNERYLSEGQRLVHMGSWAFNPDGYFDYWSQELFEIYGLDPKQGAPTLERYLATLHPQDRDSMAQTIQTMHLERIGCDVKKRILRPGGELRFVRCVGIPIIKDEILKGFLGTAIDITEQELLMRELERREAYLAESQRLNHTGSLAYDPKTLVATYWSRECLRIWDFDPDLGPPKTEALAERIHPEDRERIRKYAQEAIRSRKDFSQEFRIVLRDGTIKHIHSANHLLFGARGEPVEVLGTHVDITERKRAEQERERLRQLEADLAHINRVSMLGEMGASLAHEIKQPLAAAITSANSCMEWLSHDPPNLERARAAAARIDKYGNRAAQIIDHIRSLYTKSPSHRELVDVNAIVHEIFTLLRDEAIRYSITMRPELGAELPKIEADRIQLQQVFMNLMLNGIESMQHSGGDLTVKSQLQDGLLLFSVRDTGLGLPTENIGQIFSAFFTTKPQGSGMGLAISRSIVESHGGRLWATPNDGPGATFHFTLPNRATHPSSASV